MDLEQERQVSENVPLNKVSSGSSASRGKTPLRLRYEAEVRVLKAQLGSIEDIRQQLGLTQRKVCQLLMVDPSTWTRWLKDEDRVPPHIYRAFQWYLQLIDKKPEWHPQQSFHPLSQGLLTSNNSTEELEALRGRMEGQSFQLKQQLKDITETWQTERAELLEKIEKKDAALTGWKLFVLLNSLALFLLWFFS